MVHSEKTWTPDRMGMMLLALVESVVLVLVFVQIHNVLSISEESTSKCLSCKTNNAENETDDTKSRLLSMFHLTYVSNAFSMFALLAVGLYYGIGKKLVTMTNSMDRQAFGRNSHRSAQKISLATTKSHDSIGSILCKLVVVTIGAIGIVAATVTPLVLRGAGMYIDHVVWVSQEKRTEALYALNVAMVASLVVLICKLTEALIGHAWAVLLSNKRDDCIRMQEHVSTSEESQILQSA